VRHNPVVWKISLGLGVTAVVLGLFGLDAPGGLAFCFSVLFALAAAFNNAARDDATRLTPPGSRRRVPPWLWQSGAGGSWSDDAGGDGEGRNA
jgi:hypothetical protein